MTARDGLSPGQSSAQLLEWAREEGFDRAGIAELRPSEYGPVLERWLERGDHAGMAWFERSVERRLDPRRLLEGSVSALCVALQYWPRAGEEEPEGDLWPRVARYAHGEDYHRVMERRLRRLGERVEAEFPGARTRTYVDTGPVLERELAQRAGLGTIGKNTNLLHREGGSWFLLGELLTTLDLEPSEPSPTDACGRCTRCLDACPTGALPEPFRLDANRCISYWTIEHRGVFPDQVREWLGDWVFGCDVCQEVCPWNRRVTPSEHGEMELPAVRRELDLVALLELERDEYVERFRHSPIKRAKLEGLRRNAAVAMGNRRDGRYAEALDRALESADSGVRVHAAWALGQIGAEAARRGDESSVSEARASLAAVLSRAPGRELGDEIEAALGRIDDASLERTVSDPESG